jgi:DNA-binding LacI/PurR family transcriptional regulator
VRASWPELLTVAQTLRQQGRRVYDFLTDAVDAHRREEEPPRHASAPA